MDFFLVNNAIHNSSPSVVWLVFVYDPNPVLWLIPWVNYRGFNSLAIETQLHATSHVFVLCAF